MAVKATGSCVPQRLADCDETAKTIPAPKASETDEAEEATATAEAAKATAPPISTSAKTAREATESVRRATGGNDYLDQGSLAMAR